MNTLVTIACLMALFLLCSVRNVTLDARSPREMADIVRAHGWRSLVVLTRTVAVVLLLMAAGLCQAGRIAIQIAFGLLMHSAIRMETGRHQRRLVAA